MFLTRAKRLGLFWFFCALLYWAFVGKVDAQEMAAAGIVGLAVAVVLIVVAERVGLDFPMRARWFGLLVRRLPANLLRDVSLMAVLLWRAIAKGKHARGAYSRIPFCVGGGDALSAMRRALVFAAVSLTPKTFVIGVSGQTALLVHHLGGPPEQGDKDFPI